MANIQPHQTSKIFEKLRINFASPLLFCFFFRFTSQEKVLAAQKEKEELKALLPTSELPEASLRSVTQRERVSRTRVEPLRQDTKLKELKDLEKESKEQMKHR